MELCCYVDYLKMATNRARWVGHFYLWADLACGQALAVCELTRFYFIEGVFPS